MTAEAFATALDLLSDRRPFRPFTVILNTGNKFEVDSPKGLVYRDGVGMFMAPGGKPWLFDHESVTQFIGDMMEQTSEN